jgi:hypothetical protein
MIRDVIILWDPLKRCMAWVWVGVEEALER